MDELAETKAQAVVLTWPVQRELLPEVLKSAPVWVDCSERSIIFKIIYTRVLVTP